MEYIKLRPKFQPSGNLPEIWILEFHSPSWLEKSSGIWEKLAWADLFPRLDGKVSKRGGWSEDSRSHSVFRMAPNGLVCNNNKHLKWKIVCSPHSIRYILKKKRWKEALHIYVRSYYMPGTVPGTGATGASKMESLLAQRVHPLTEGKGSFICLLSKVVWRTDKFHEEYKRR